MFAADEEAATLSTAHAAGEELTRMFPKFLFSHIFSPNHLSRKMAYSARSFTSGRRLADRGRLKQGKWIEFTRASWEESHTSGGSEKREKVEAT